VGELVGLCVVRTVYVGNSDGLGIDGPTPSHGDDELCGCLCICVNKRGK
jgi:hypothetical protein